MRSTSNEAFIGRGTWDPCRGQGAGSCSRPTPCCSPGLATAWPLLLEAPTPIEVFRAPTAFPPRPRPRPRPTPAARPSVPEVMHFLRAARTLLNAAPLLQPTRDAIDNVLTTAGLLPLRRRPFEVGCQAELPALDCFIVVLRPGGNWAQLTCLSTLRSARRAGSTAGRTAAGSALVGRRRCLRRRGEPCSLPVCYFSHRFCCAPCVAAH